MKHEKGYTIAEATVALFIFGLMIGLMFPLFEEVRADANDQSDLVEIHQWVSEQMERLTSSCTRDRNGKIRRKLVKTHTWAQMKWECKQMDQWLIQVSVEVQWKNRKGEDKNHRIQTHRFRAS